MEGVQDEYTIGVEEEFFLVDRATRRLAPVASDVLPRAQTIAGDAVQSELQQSQVETNTRVCRTLGEVRAELTRLRRALASAADQSGCAIAASGTHPLGLEEGSEITPEPAYRRLERQYRLISHEQLVCGCHVHVGLDDPEQAVQVMNRVRPWLPVLLALSVNSPFWNGRDSGYSSFRTEVWRRWPLSGPPQVFASRAEYDDLVATLMKVEAIDDPARIYWDVRPSAKFATLEFRVADAGLTVDDTVMHAGLVRALVRTCHRQLGESGAPTLPRPELLQAAAWRAARYGLGGTLIDFEECRSRPAPELVEAFLDFVQPALEEGGDDEISARVGTMSQRGTGAHRQRRAFADAHRLEDVVDLILTETAPGVPAD